MSKRLAMTALLLAVLAGVGTGLRSARERRGPPEGPWVDASGKPLPDASESSEGLVLRVFHGHEHCEWQSVTFLELAWPLGAIARSPLSLEDYRQYVRDPERAFLPAFHPEPFESGVALPGDARPTGYHSGSWKLWLSESEADRYVYLVHGKRAERWPRARTPIYCK